MSHISFAQIQGSSQHDPRHTDPYGERYLGLFDFIGEPCMWKIDYYDAQLKHGSHYSADESVTRRALIITRARTISLKVLKSGTRNCNVDHPVKDHSPSSTSCDAKAEQPPNSEREAQGQIIDVG
jgi:hypothetical protein